MATKVDVKQTIADAKKITKLSEARAAQMFVKEFSPAVKSVLNDIITEGISVGSAQPDGYEPQADKDAIMQGKNINKDAGDGPDDQDGGFNKGGKYPSETVNDVHESHVDGMEDEDKKEEEEEGLEPNIDDELGTDNEPLGHPEEEDEAFTTGSDTDELGLDSKPGEEEDEVYEFDGKDQAGGEDEFGLGDKTSPEDDEVLEVVDDADFDLQGDEQFPKTDEDEEEEGKGVYEAKYKKLRKFAKKIYAENKKLKRAVYQLHEGFNKLNLYNARLSYAYNLLTRPGLTRNEKRRIAEAFDKARSLREAKLIYTTIKSNLGTRSISAVSAKAKNVRSVISESTRPKSNAQSADQARMNVLSFGEQEQND